MEGSMIVVKVAGYTGVS